MEFLSFKDYLIYFEQYLWTKVIFKMTLKLYLSTKTHNLWPPFVVCVNWSYHVVFTVRLDSTKTMQGLVTARNEVGTRLCFYTCLWFCSQGGVSVSVPGVSPSGGGSLEGSLSWGVSVWGSLSRGVSVWGGLCPGGGLCHGDPPYGNERAVRILLKCILA